MLVFKLPLYRISWPLFALSLSRVHQVHSFVTRQKSSQAMRPCRQHLLLNKLLLCCLVSCFGGCLAESIAVAFGEVGRGGESRFVCDFANGLVCAGDECSCML